MAGSAGSKHTHHRYLGALLRVVATSVMLLLATVLIGCATEKEYTEEMLPTEIPAIDLNVPTELETATFALG